MNDIIALIFDLLEEYGVREIICSPGSRNASLLSEADKREAFTKYTVIDERSAGFMALGMSMVSRRPVALICTSGTALLNYAPALAEARYHHIPLIVISADRPGEWIDQDDSQTILQPGVYANFGTSCIDLDVRNVTEDYLWYANRIVNEGLIGAVCEIPGPLHINVHIPNLSLIPKKKLDYKARKFDYVKRENTLPREVLKNLVKEAEGKKILIVAGFMPPDNKLQKAFLYLYNLPNVNILAETLSNLHLPAECYKIDKLLFSVDEKEMQLLKPDILISMGGALVSRKLKEFLRKVRATQHWVVGKFSNVVDCFQSLTTIIDTDPASFLPYFAKRLTRLLQTGGEIAAYKEKWMGLRFKYLETKPNKWCDLTALDIIFKAIPSSANLFLSNGTPVRYAQILDSNPPHASYCNRGVSGIEGSTSTAIGGACVYPDITCLITGDLSFNYDLSAISNFYIPDNFKLIVIDNSGGDIFRFIKATSSLPIREDYLCMDPETPLEELAMAYGWFYYKADDVSSLENILPEFFENCEAPSLLHIDTSSSPNSDILTSFLKTLSNKK